MVRTVPRNCLLLSNNSIKRKRVRKNGVVLRSKLKRPPRWWGARANTYRLRMRARSKANKPHLSPTAPTCPKSFLSFFTTSSRKIKLPVGLTGMFNKVVLRAGFNVSVQNTRSQENNKFGVNRETVWWSLVQGTNTKCCTRGTQLLDFQANSSWNSWEATLLMARFGPSRRLVYRLIPALHCENMREKRGRDDVGIGDWISWIQREAKESDIRLIAFREKHVKLRIPSTKWGTRATKPVLYPETISWINHLPNGNVTCSANRSWSGSLQKLNPKSHFFFFLTTCSFLKVKKHLK